MVIYLVAAALFVVAVVEVLAWALCAVGYWLLGLFVAAAPSSSRFG